MSNVKFNELISKVSALDTFTQSVILASWMASVNASAINQAIRYVPDEPVDNGIEQFTEYDAARRQLRVEAEDGRSTLPSLIGLHRELFGYMDVLGHMAPATFESTLAWMSEKAPKKETFARDYIERIRQGMKPGIPLQKFVEHEYEAAMRQHNRLVARGEDAIRLCETCSEDTGMGTLPERLLENMERKMISKLHDAWMRNERTRTDIKRPKEIRDEATSNQTLICHVLGQYGENPVHEGADPELEALLKAAAPKADDFGKASNLNDLYDGKELAYRR